MILKNQILVSFFLNFLTFFIEFLDLFNKGAKLVRSQKKLTKHLNNFVGKYDRIESYFIYIQFQLFVLNSIEEAKRVFHL